MVTKSLVPSNSRVPPNLPAVVQIGPLTRIPLLPLPETVDPGEQRNCQILYGTPFLSMSFCRPPSISAQKIGDCSGISCERFDRVQTSVPHVSVGYRTVSIARRGFCAVAGRTWRNAPLAMCLHPRRVNQQLEGLNR